MALDSTIEAKHEGGSEENPQVTVTLHIDKETAGIEARLQDVLLRVALDLTNGDKEKAARILGICSKTMYNRLHKAGLHHQYIEQRTPHELPVIP